MTSYTGECFCGAVGYKVDGQFSQTRACHCSRCRKAFSGAGSAVGFLEPGQFAWTRGEELVKSYADEEGTGLTFCGTCGSTLSGMVKGRPFCVTLGTLNGDPDLEIERHIFVASKASWDKIGGDAPRYAEHPDDLDGLP